tara:strand:- start:4567 stop:6159 length:1593 start_codon:yes stop_codon:yes gene_type:complete
MSNTNISFEKTGYFSKLICDYVGRKESVDKLYNNYPDLKGFEKQISLKEKQFSNKNREVLVSSLQKQYVSTKITEKTKNNINSLVGDNTFTTVTGHQLNVFTGPLYFLYKIASAINLAKELKHKFPENQFVPVYWMATEDHDFEEINHFFVGDKKIIWKVDSSGPVGRKLTSGFETVLEEFSNTIGDNKNANYLKQLFKKAYLEHNTLAEATRFLVNELFGVYGLVIVDGDDVDLKKQFSPFVEKELVDKYAHQSIANANSFLEENYNVQVNPREINLFYIEDELRERIIFENDTYKVNNTAIEFTKDEILDELKKSPEKFSPNVIMRPLFQEVVLPNLCYIGGGGELAYWFQLKNLFAKSNIVFPVLLLRNSVLLASEKQGAKLGRLNLSYQELFLKQQVLFDIKIKECSELPLDFEFQKNKLRELFDELKPLVAQTDVSFSGALEAQEKKQLKGLLNLEKRLLKAEKKKHVDVVNRIRILQDELFPRNGLQERNVNFAEFYIEYGENLIPTLLKELKPLGLLYTVLEM